jgi:hypothetical protein
MMADTPDLCLFKLHLEGAPFLAGVDAGNWGLMTQDESSHWPFCRIWILSNPRFIPGGKVLLRVQADNYPATAPTSRPWDIEADIPLKPELWPKGPRNVSAVFNPKWNGGVAIYAPCDRMRCQVTKNGSESSLNGGGHPTIRSSNTSPSFSGA